MPKQVAAHLVETTTPYWQESPMPQFPALDGHRHADVVVVGGGITGLTAAYLLSGAGKSVVLLERGLCAHVDTGHTSAHLTMVTDKSLTELVSAFGRDHAQAVWKAGLAAIAQIEAIVRDEAIVCAFQRVPGYLHGPIGAAPGDADSFGEEARLATELGFAASPVDRVPFIGGPGVRFEQQARFHPRQYLAGLARVLERRGVQIHEHSAAGAFSADPIGITVNGHTVRCDDLVIATHDPIVGNAGMTSATLLQTKLALYTTYVVAGRIAKGQIEDALYWELADPYHYLRVEPHRDYDLVIFGGEDHKTGQVPDTGACYDRLGRTLTALLPEIDLSHRWSGQVIETADGLPYIGETAGHQFAATGFSGNGMTFGTLGAMMACDRITGRRNPWADLFDTGRTNIQAGLWDYVRENTDYPYYLARDRFAGAEGQVLGDVPRGEGRIVELDGRKVAAFRDEQGTVTMRSAMCPHMGCVVQFNRAERTWDCPCHGSRFMLDGGVISGPAQSPLGEP